MEVNQKLAALLSEAKAAIKAGKPDRACEILKVEQETGWNDAQYLSLLGAACCMAGRPKDGLEALDRALQIAPSATTHYNLGQAHHLAGHLEEAKTCYEHALSLDPVYHKALHALESFAPKRENQSQEAGGRHIEVAEEYHVSEHAHLLTEPPTE